MDANLTSFLVNAKLSHHQIDCFRYCGLSHAWITEKLWSEFLRYFFLFTSSSSSDFFQKLQWVVFSLLQKANQNQVMCLTIIFTYT